MVANSAVAVSPSAPIGDGMGGALSAHVKSYMPDIASTIDAYAGQLEYGDGEEPKPEIDR